MAGTTNSRELALFYAEAHTSATPKSRIFLPLLRVRTGRVNHCHVPLYRTDNGYYTTYTRGGLWESPQRASDHTVDWFRGLPRY
jgi:hypothetical protein